MSEPIVDVTHDFDPAPDAEARLEEVVRILLDEDARQGEGRAA